MEPSNKIVMIKVSELTNHPVADLIPMLPEDHPRSLALTESVGADGIQEPLICDPKGRVVNGRHRLRSVRNYPSITEVPCVVKPEDQVATIAMQTALSRREFNESQRALMVAMLFPKTQEERTASHPASSKKDGIGSKSTGNGNPTQWGHGITIKEFAQMHDVGVAFMEYALRVMGQPSERRDQAIKDVMARGIGLGRVVAGWGGKDSTFKKEKAGHNYGRLIGNSLASLSRYGKGYSKMNKVDAADALRLAEEMPLGLAVPLLKAVNRGVKKALAQIKD